ncbi:hypothetical protein ACFVY1_34960 [Streptomyces sp. NPDC058293]|uniref:hypothetical protein n=1 Tax=Streptomyces sp. NPDC058293 TaxID=3346429 RepID=UPI0036E559BA
MAQEGTVLEIAKSSRVLPATQVVHATKVAASTAWGSARRGARFGQRVSSAASSTGGPANAANRSTFAPIGDATEKVIRTPAA